jgi:hypothetical protein
VARTSLSAEHRKLLSRAVLNARREAEAGARESLRALAVDHHEPFGHMDAEARKLRNALRAHGRQLGDELDPKRGTQSIDRLTHEVAFEHWHRMLFARFLAENGLLMHPTLGASVTLEECQELARDEGKDPWDLAAGFAQLSLPQIFRQDDPALRIPLPANARTALERIVSELPAEVFHATDALGWVYQFWQTEKKDEVNASGKKIGADELSPVTQLFTEDYMVDFLLDNTLGAWWAGKVLAREPGLATGAKTEDELRQAVSLPGCSWSYLRFIKTDDGAWRPAAGTFDGWPKSAAALRALDPCMGSGHFVVAMFERLVALRLAEEKLDEAAAVAAVIRDNVFGLEIDPRCTQIGAFNLALAAWRRVGHCKLPAMNLACSGLAPNTREADWVAIAGGDSKLRNGMERLYRLFKHAPVLGSLINPRTGEGDLLAAAFHELQPLLERALAQETKDDTAHEMAVTARGLAKAAEILAGQFTLVATNVPYLGREGHADDLINFADGYAPDASADLATLMLHRGFQFTRKAGIIGVVLPQNWWVGKSYSDFRKRVLAETSWRFAAVLGEEAWQAFGNRGPNTILLVVEGDKSGDDNAFSALDVSTKPGTPVVGPETKARALAGGDETEELKRLSKVIRVGQRQLSLNREARISVAQVGSAPPLSKSVVSGEGCSTGDNDRFLRSFWELSEHRGWLRYSGPGFEHWSYCDNSLVVLWEDGKGELARSSQARIQNTELWERSGVLVGRVRGITATLFSGGCFSKGAVLVCPRDRANQLPIYAFLRSKEFENLVRTIDPRVSAATSVLTDVPFDLPHWQKVAAEIYPHGLPKPFSSDPTQWLFNGHPAGAVQPLHVAVARLLGYQWPRQTGSRFPDCPALSPDVLEGHADDDGIVPMNPMRGEPAASERVLALLRESFVAKGLAFDLGVVAGLLGDAGGKSTDLNDWLLNEFFDQHCKLFHNRPFVWHIWDGRKDGFNVLVNYHRLAAPGDAGRQLLEKLTYDYLKDWIDRQQDGVKASIAGAEARLAAAIELQKELIKIISGEPPYDLFVRWKPLADQAIGWQPDINDGVRLNIRPFLKAQDVGKKGAGILRSKPNIKWDKDRGKEPERAKTDFPWFWSCDPETNAAHSTDFSGGREFTGERWNDLHYTVAAKNSARERRAKEKK